MLRRVVLCVTLIATTTIASGGCQSCSSCHDYDPPVADSNCDAYGTHRAGSVSNCGCSGCSGGGCNSGGCSTGGCNCGSHGGGYVESHYSDGGYPVDDGYTTEGTTGTEPMQNAAEQP